MNVFMLTSQVQILTKYREHSNSDSRLMYCACSVTCCSHLQLDRMLEAFNLDVDLPNVIVDKASSTLLMSGTPAERYQYFLEATGLVSSST
jgi:hypothetical protein